MVVREGFLVLFLEYVDLLFIISFCKRFSVMSFEVLFDMYGVDYPFKLLRYEVSYGLLSLKHGVRWFLRSFSGYLKIEGSVSDVYLSSLWLEREVYDMLGVRFEGNVSMRRILTDYCFIGYPLQKSFPVYGYFEVFYNESNKFIIREPVEFSQTFRLYECNTPWDFVMEYVGDVEASSLKSTFLKKDDNSDNIIIDFFNFYFSYQSVYKKSKNFYFNFYLGL